MASVLLGCFLWSYWPVLVELVAAWEREPDYSHGYLVVPVALYILWSRRSDCPAGTFSFHWLGLLPLAACFAIRMAGSLWYIDFLQAWSIPFWVAGVCWCLGGWAFLRWALPGIGFLAFMIPLPFRAETMLSLPLQSIASRISCFMLQVLGQPAIREGNVVIVNDLELMIVEACSGLRIFMSIIAVAYVYAALVQRPWWIKAGLILSVVPIALLVNALRITVTALLHFMVSGEAAHKFSHDAAGWFMMPVAAVMMAGIIWYLGRLVFEVEAESAGDVLRGSR